MTQYSHPSLHTDVFVTDTEPELERTPTSEEGEVLEVDFEYANYLAKISFVR